jgi:NAD-dependent dihydropyrimidine dehydrogenase PreA subunit
MQAINISESYQGASGDSENELLIIDDNKCIGCGICASNCPQESIVLLKVRDDLPETTLRGMWQRVELERLE